MVFSNSEPLSSRIRSRKRMDERRIVFSFGVTYDTEHDHLKANPEIVRSIAKDQEQSRFDRSRFDDFGDSALKFETVCSMSVPDSRAYVDTRQAVISRCTDASGRPVSTSPSRPAPCTWSTPGTDGFAAR
ncbi:MAG: hypothetical protein ACLFWG_01190 [Longimicrobiales bacterium]